MQSSILYQFASMLLRTVVEKSCNQSFLQTLALFFLGFAARRAWKTWRNSRLLPPGPSGLPILGYIPFIKSDFHEELTSLSRKYGPVFRVQLGSQLMVILSDHRLIREAFRREEFSGRPSNQFTKILDGYGLINTEGRLWKSQRKFVHERLRQFGVKQIGTGREVMESRIMTEVEGFLHNVATQRSAPVDLSNYLSSAVSNIICSMLMSVRFSHDDPRFLRFTYLIEEGFRLFTAIAAAMLIPLLRFLPGVSATYNKILANRQEIGCFFQEVIDVHKKTFDPNNVRDIIDSYLLEIYRSNEEGFEISLFDGRDADRQMQQIIGDMFSAGSETVKTTLQWATVFALHHPGAQKKVQEELDRVVGRRRLPSLSDLPNLPYTEAFICEVMRRVTVAPLGTTHATTRTTTLNGYVIPKGTQVIPLLHAVHMDPILWKDPEQFMPERFLTDEGQVKKPEFFMPFGTGRRVCLGDTLAKSELALFFSSLLHVFTLQVPEGDPLPSLRGNPGVTITPTPFKVCAVPRQTEEILFP